MYFYFHLFVFYLFISHFICFSVRVKERNVQLNFLVYEFILKFSPVFLSFSFFLFIFHLLFYSFICLLVSSFKWMRPKYWLIHSYVKCITNFIYFFLKLAHRNSSVFLFINSIFLIVLLHLIIFSYHSYLIILLFSSIILH